MPSAKSVRSTSTASMSRLKDQIERSLPSSEKRQEFRKHAAAVLLSVLPASSSTSSSPTTTSSETKSFSRTRARVDRWMAARLPRPRSVRVDHGLSWNSRHVEWEQQWPLGTRLLNRFSADLASQHSEWDQDTEVTLSLAFELSRRSIPQRVCVWVINSLTSSLTSGR